MYWIKYQSTSRKTNFFFFLILNAFPYLTDQEDQTNHLISHGPFKKTDRASYDTEEISNTVRKLEEITVCLRSGQAEKSKSSLPITNLP